MKKLKSKWTVFWIFAILQWMPVRVMACATCMGSPNEPLTQGLNAGIASLLAIVLMVLSGAAAFFIYLARRAAAVAKQQQNNA